MRAYNGGRNPVLKERIPMSRKIVLALGVLAAIGGGTVAYNMLTAAPAMACSESGGG
jgi:hypothetical protein